MKTKIIEAVSPQGNHGKFMIGRMDVEWGVRSQVEEPRSVLARAGWTPHHLWVLDLQTGEGAFFRPGGYAKADLDKHAVWVCPLFEPFLTWLYTQPLEDLDALPTLVEVAAPLQMAGYRRPGPQ